MAHKKKKREVTSRGRLTQRQKKLIGKVEKMTRKAKRRKRSGS